MVWLLIFQFLYVCAITYEDKTPTDRGIFFFFGGRGIQTKSIDTFENESYHKTPTHRYC